MKRRTFTLLILALLGVFVLSACGGGLAGDTEEAIEDLLKDGNGDKWNDIVCDDLKYEDDEADEQEMEDFDSVSCEEEDDRIKCEVEADGETLKISYAIDDDKICDPELEE